MSKGCHIRNRLLLYCGLLSVPIFLGSRFFSTDTTWSAGEVPIAFWSWRNETPSDDQVKRVVESTKAETLFLRAGQIDAGTSNMPARIRAARGRMPSSVALHLVYNGTPDFLRRFESLQIVQLSGFLVETFREDSRRAASDGATIQGLQLDFDIPTRLLPRYAELLRQTRRLLPPGMKLSVTGLPTWMSSPQLLPVLDSVDFWVPQFYGAGIPFRTDQKIPISSSASVAEAIARTASLGRPFYAGLSAYGYAVLYSPNGDLLELRGDIDPAAAARSDQLEHVGTSSYEKTSDTSEVMYVYRAKSDLVLQGMVIRQGETLVFDQPTEASLRAAARAVRKNGGSSLLGICVFRLPTNEDETTLSLAEIKSAIDDSVPKVSTSLELTENGQTLTLEALNAGTASGLIGDNAFTADFYLPPGSFSGLVRLDGFSSLETLCTNGTAEPIPCSQRRANVIRFAARSWKPSTRAAAVFNLSVPVPQSVRSVTTTRVSDARVAPETFELTPIIDR